MQCISSLYRSPSFLELKADEMRVGEPEIVRHGEYWETEKNIYDLPKFKKYFDEVFAYGWAFGPGGDKLKGKRIGLAISMGGDQSSYNNGLSGFVLLEIDLKIAVTPGLNQIQ